MTMSRIKTVMGVAANFYEAHRAMKAFHGDKFDEKIAETRKIVERVQDQLGCGAFEAAIFLIEKIAAYKPFEGGMTVAMLLATAVEMTKKRSVK